MITMAAAAVENVGPGRQPVWLADSSERLEKKLGEPLNETDFVGLST
jgi:hypothetical protein